MSPAVPARGGAVSSSAGGATTTGGAGDVRKAYVGPSPHAHAQHASAPGDVRRIFKCYYDATGDVAGKMECVRLNLDGVNTVKDLKRRVIQDFSLQLTADIVEQANDQNASSITANALLAAGMAQNKPKQQQSSTPSSSHDEPLNETNDDIANTVPKIKLKYLDSDNDYVTVLDRTDITEVLTHAVSLHVYLAQVIEARQLKSQESHGLVDIL